jgi:hypothetical protein
VTEGSASKIDGDAVAAQALHDTCYIDPAAAGISARRTASKLARIEYPLD